MMPSADAGRTRSRQRNGFKAHKPPFSSGRTASPIARPAASVQFGERTFDLRGRKRQEGVILRDDLLAIPAEGKPEQFTDMQSRRLSRRSIYIDVERTSQGILSHSHTFWGSGDKRTGLGDGQRQILDPRLSVGKSCIADPVRI